MISCVWLFVFSAHSVHSSLYSNRYRNGFQNSYKNFNHPNILPTIVQTTDLIGESRWIQNSNLNTKTMNHFRNRASENSGDQMLTDSSNEDQLIDRNYDSDSYSSPSKKYKKTHPYSFGYEVTDSQGNKQYRHEKKQEQTVTGTYGYLDGMTGIYRHVYYIADQNGFRAKIKTTEPGTMTSNSSHVEIESSPIQISSSKEHHKQMDYQQKASDSFIKQTEPFIEMRTTGKQLKPYAIYRSNNYIRNSPTGYMSTNTDHNLNVDDHENSFNRNNEDRDESTSKSHVNDSNDVNHSATTNNDVPIRMLNDDAINEPFNEQQQQNDQTDDQQDEHYQQSPRQRQYRARLF